MSTPTTEELIEAWFQALWVKEGGYGEPSPEDLALIGRARALQAEVEGLRAALGSDMAKQPIAPNAQ